MGTVRRSAAFLNRQKRPFESVRDAEGQLLVNRLRFGIEDQPAESARTSGQKAGGARRQRCAGMGGIAGAYQRLPLPPFAAAQRRRASSCVALGCIDILGRQRQGVQTTRPCASEGQKSAAIDCEADHDRKHVQQAGKQPHREGCRHAHAESAFCGLAPALELYLLEGVRSEVQGTCFESA